MVITTHSLTSWYTVIVVLHELIYLKHFQMSPLLPFIND